MILPKFKEGDLVSASDWNLIASEVNRIWGNEVDSSAGLEMVKGEPWRIRYTGTGGQVINRWFNNTCRKVYVYRADGWDYGGESAPIAFYVAGNFTSLNNRQTLRLAKVIRGSGGRSSRATAFCNSVKFSTGTSFLSLNKDTGASLLVGGENRNSFNGGSLANAHMIDLDAGTPVAGFTGPDFPSLPMQGMVSMNGGCLFHTYTELRATDYSGATTATHSSPVNMHNLVTDGNNAWLSMRRVFTGVPTGYDGDHYPDGIRQLDYLGNIVGAWDAAAGFGAGCCCFFAALPPKELWIGGDNYIYTSASLEYQNSQDMTWDGVPFGYGGQTAGILKVGTDGVLGGVSLGIDHLGPDFVDPRPPNSDRAWMFCKSPSGELWFGGGVDALYSSAGSVSTSNYKLYKFNENTNAITYISGFNDTVYDCQFFSEVNGTQQFIVVGAFTEYNGETAERIVFIDQDGNRLSDLEWP